MELRSRTSLTRKHRHSYAQSRETKILDPAVGSGAFPMAALHKLTLALRKLDPANDLWEGHQRSLAMERTEEAFEADSKSDRDEMLEDISEVFRNLQRQRLRTQALPHTELHLRCGHPAHRRPDIQATFLHISRYRTAAD